MSQPAEKRNRPSKIGKVVGKSGRKTIKVNVERYMMHPVYKRYVRQSKRYLVHDENEVCDLGDKVRIIESAPLSARKRWRLSEVLAKSEIAMVEKEAGNQ
jgi:small subunit ribosomal protein S17